jgi:chromosome partitioning protein
MVSRHQIVESLRSWHRVRTTSQEHDGVRTIAIISQKGGAGKTTLALHIAVAAELAGYSTVVLDMDPQGTAEAWSEWRQEAPPIAEAEARAAAKTSDLVLVPCRPNAFDVHSIKTTSDLTRFAAKPAFAIFNSGPINAAKLYAETAEVVTEIGLAVAPVRLSERAAFRHATGSGKTAQETDAKGKAAEEVGALWVWICQQVGVPPRVRANTRTKVTA